MKFQTKKLGGGEEGGGGEGGGEGGCEFKFLGKFKKKKYWGGGGGGVGSGGVRWGVGLVGGSGWM